ncbi:MAG: ATP-binding protein [Burkholderiaceae bacterium]
MSWVARSAMPALAPVITLLGGESCGKSTLALALHQRLAKHHGLRVALVPEYLRSWCQAHGRVPQSHEQDAIAAVQSRQIAEASATPGVQLVVSDSSALSIAAYSELYFQDTSLWHRALNAQSGYQATLLMGLDLPWVPDGLFRESVEFRNRADTLLRRALQGAGLPFQTVYGAANRRLHNALRALSPTLSPLLGHPPVPTDEAQVNRRPGWVCESCSDPDCEHRLFTGLLKAAPAAPSTP